MTKQLLLARHAATGPDYYGRFIGASDLSLGPDGPTQAQRLAEIIAPYQPEAILCSPMLRARQTIELIRQQVNLPEPEISQELREINFGAWEKLSFNEIAGKDHNAELVKRWSIWSPDFSFPKGEKVADFLERVRRETDQLSKRPEETILIMAHGGVIRAMICHLLGLPDRNYLLFDVKPARLAIIDLFTGNKGVLSGLNL
ncbi:MAG: histidine phosphatase family protein [Proteobacteria bacterium]|nr:histidine phosphatase family protein [Pseudomonadota bacterium]MBU1715043.1 histidine phosphatase family protein [Pseudomonadota bacterium]